MKKIMILAVTALALAACAKTYEVKETTPPEIGFGAWPEMLTKTEARVQGTSTFLAGDTFAVYGSKTDATPTTTTVFNGDVVTASGSGSLTWDYSNHRYWDASAVSYTFFAVSPSGVKDETGASINAQTGAITTASTVFSGKNNDILIADKTVVNKNSGSDTPLTYFNSYAAVNLVFNHAAALVDVKVKKSTNLHSSDVKISAISLENIKNTGVLSIADNQYNKTVSPRTTVPNITIASWTSSNPVTYLPAAGVTAVYGDTDTSSPIAVGNEKVITEDTAFNPATPATPAASTTLFNNLIVVPQTFGATGVSSSQKISITYKLGSDPTSYTREAYLADFDIVDDADQDDTKTATGFEPGKYYTLYITIDAHEILFDAEIDDWTTETGYHYLIN